MKRRALLIGAAAVVLGSTAAWALKIQVDMTPRNLGAQGFKIKSNRDGEDVKFVVQRDLKKSTWPKRSGYLSLPKEEGKSKDAIVKPVEKDRIQTYRFTVPAKQLDGATFTITEVQTANGEPDGEDLLGGGTFYQFRLADFTRPR